MDYFHVTYKDQKLISTWSLVIVFLLGWNATVLGQQMGNSSTDSQPLFKDHTQQIDKRVQDLISRLTLEEKAAILNYEGPVIERFGIKADGWNQNMHGVWWDRPTTLFPVPMAMAASWDTTLVKEVSSAIADESRAIYNWWNTDSDFWGEERGLIYRQPVVNMARNPYWGRNYEIWGEDPYLAGRMSVAYINGFRDPHHPEYLKIAPTAKHFAVNNIEEERRLHSAFVEERWLHEYWLSAFKDAILEGGVEQVMASYNAINGVPNVMNKHLLTNILKEKWGYDGFVVSDAGGVEDLIDDWGNYNFEINYDRINSWDGFKVDETMAPVEAVANSMNAGVDFDGGEFTEYIPDAVRQGLLSEDRLNEALTRHLRTRFEVGDFDPFHEIPYSDISPDVIGSFSHRQLSLETAQKSMTLLTNKNDFLPLDKKELESIAVIGPLADTFIPGGYTGEWENPITPLQGIKNHAAEGTKIRHVIGGQISPPEEREHKLIDKEQQLQKAVDAAKNSEVSILFVGTNEEIESEGEDREQLGLPGNQKDLVQKVHAANPNTVVVLINAGPMTISWTKENVPAILEAWIAGEEGGNAMADALFGDINPGGKLPITVYASEEQVPPQDEYDISEGFTYMYLNGEPLYPFGHGLSYTDFEYNDFEISSESIPNDGEFNVSVTVENVGERAGTEVVQVYGHDRKSSVVQPQKELLDFHKTKLKPGEEKEISFNIPAERLSYYDVESDQSVVEPGTFDIRVGSSSADIRANGSVVITD